jgi:hypothetical protein
MPDDGGVIENLPRSRPGKRSEKRAGADAEPGQEPPRAATERPGAAAAEAAERSEGASADAAAQAERATAAAEAAPAKPSDRARATAEAPSEAAPPKPSDRARAKRASGAPAPGRTRTTPKARAKAGDETRPKAGDRARVERSAPSGRRQPVDPVPKESTSGHPDPVGGLIRGAVKVAGTGVRVAGAVAGEVMRRLPRP